MRWTKNKEAFKDPVCGMTIDPYTTNTHTCHKGQTVYFCSQGCLRTFLSSPEKYGRIKKKNFWRRYVERLNKAVASNPPSCHG